MDKFINKIISYLEYRFIRHSFNAISLKIKAHFNKISKR